MSQTEINVAPRRLHRRAMRRCAPQKWRPLWCLHLLSPLVHRAAARDVFCVARPVEMLRCAALTRTNAAEVTKSVDTVPERSLRTQFVVLIGDECRRRPIAGAPRNGGVRSINTFLEIGRKRVESDSSTLRDIGDTRRVSASQSRRDRRNQGVESMHGIGSSDACRGAL